MLLRITKTCSIREGACTGWSYNKETDTTTFFLVNKTTLSAKGDWVSHIPKAKQMGAIETNGKILTMRQ
jgi:hypothetical protein